ncbi:hypothetical protein DO97_02915 [Neosynechococcus sphagnicola sy1]|uniref:Uncharacterized protein n=1 Tax=Neosynechococcus sphagnicola sy1 TaxID=1497020 RepID=A0A098TL46_9CYAN|nr:hypothetical protein DO97_02915 [Neosynechococcus sphagnicola sy1]
MAVPDLHCGKGRCGVIRDLLDPGIARIGDSKAVSLGCQPRVNADDSIIEKSFQDIAVLDIQP